MPIGVLAILMAAWILPRDAATAWARTLDLPCLLLISPGLALLLYGLESLRADSAARSLHLLEVAIALGLLALFAVRSLRRGSAALIDLNLFRDSSFSASASTMFLANAMNFGGQLLLPLYLLTILHIAPEKTGLLLAPAGLGAIIAYPSMGAFTERFGSRLVSASGSLIALLGTLAGLHPPLPPRFGSCALFTELLSSRLYASLCEHNAETANPKLRADLFRYAGGVRLRRNS